MKRDNDKQQQKSGNTGKDENLNNKSFEKENNNLNGDTKEPYVTPYEIDFGLIDEEVLEEENTSEFLERISSGNLVNKDKLYNHNNV